MVGAPTKYGSTLEPIYIFYVAFNSGIALEPFTNVVSHFTMEQPSNPLLMLCYISLSNSPPTFY